VAPDGLGGFVASGTLQSGDAGVSERVVPIPGPAFIAAVPANDLGLDRFNFERRALESCFPGDRGVAERELLRFDTRKLADLEKDFHDFPGRWALRKS